MFLAPGKRPARPMMATPSTESCVFSLLTNLLLLPCRLRLLGPRPSSLLSAVVSFLKRRPLASLVGEIFGERADSRVSEHLDQGNFLAESFAQLTVNLNHR